MSLSTVASPPICVPATGHSGAGNDSALLLIILFDAPAFRADI